MGQLGIVRTVREANKTATSKRREGPVTVYDRSNTVAVYDKIYISRGMNERRFTTGTTDRVWQRRHCDSLYQLKTSRTAWT